MHEIIAYGSFCACYLYYWEGTFEDLGDNVTAAYAQRKTARVRESRDPLTRFIDVPPYDPARIVLRLFGIVRKATIVCVLVYVAAFFGIAASVPLLRVAPRVTDAIPDVKSIVQGARLADDAGAVAQLLSVVTKAHKEEATTTKDAHVEKVIGALAWVTARAANVLISFLVTSLIVYSISRLVMPNVRDIQTNENLMHQYASTILFASGVAFLVILFVLETGHDLKTTIR